MSFSPIDNRIVPPTDDQVSLGEIHCELGAFSSFLRCGALIPAYNSNLAFTVKIQSNDDPNVRRFLQADVRKFPSPFPAIFVCY